jgi:hypothetical protein
VFAEQWWWHDVNLNTSVFSFISVQSKGKDIKNQATILVGRGASTQVTKRWSADQAPELIQGPGVLPNLGGKQVKRDVRGRW